MDVPQLRRSYAVCSVLIIAFGIFGLVTGNLLIAAACAVALVVGTALLWAPSWFTDGR